MSTVCTDAVLDYGLIAEIKRVGHVTGRDDLLAGFVRNLEDYLAAFEGNFSHCLARGDIGGALRAAHSLEGHAGNSAPRARRSFRRHRALCQGRKLSSAASAPRARAPADLHARCKPLEEA